ncbi:hypothetical protein METBIDRAFT_30288 [Metschnikowia bicuspidata var. bicuspidata NRRL YB-4993]|uniref:NADPH--cytochrome P450 reductase n=1 Tax=Metschnikowia bicuspidata var. bicuspidata NRRL YB-4993 TaxID=869754 RepID=A0A1A0HIC9_9ASCO|nr:hypothetical protein METBIDRAFT_30288 [Metschnikowia bicuspidata var. bicuspidata NRRL YB-4993]OBA23924.1 hypothetical protein METBIDRAFT_30288 [Metschnikowia bicuspidata var. bicuspidata NRRL YB-4993]
MLDKLDLIVITALALAVAYYYSKDFIFGSDGSSNAGFVADGGEEERDLLVKLEQNKKNSVVFYGSQTGTAEDYAHKLARELHSKFGLNVLIADLADYDFDNLKDLDLNCLMFFMVATYGEGEPTDNAVEFFNWLDNEADQVTNLKFTVFGLGNSTYEFYNAMGAKLNDKLELLGAERFAPYGQGDDGLGTMDEDFLSWKEECFDSLKSNVNLEEHELEYEPSFQLIDQPSLTSSDESVSNGEPNLTYVSCTSPITRGPFDHLHPYIARVSQSKEMFDSPSRSCVHAEFDLSPSNLKYSTGDHLAIWPSNSNENVGKFIHCFGLEEKRGLVFKLKTLDSTVQLPFPTPITYEAVIRHHLEISGPISRQALKSIAPFAPNEAAKTTSMRLGSDKLEFAENIHDKKLNLADALLHISEGEPWKSVPFVFLIELIASLQPRYYSISSSSLSEKSVIHVTAVVEAEIRGEHKVTGVATNLLKDIEVSQNGSPDVRFATYDLDGPKGKFKEFRLPVHVRRSTFKLPSNPSTPIILVGPGTGVAPMRAFIRERVALLKNSDTIKLGKSILFYGCRRKDEDFLYREEWPEYARVLGDSFEMDVAFSRESSQKVYVQDKILSRAKEVNLLLESGAFIYVCGDASKMARDVQTTIVKIISDERSISPEKAGDLVRSLKVQNRYQEDVW